MKIPLLNEGTLPADTFVASPAADERAVANLATHDDAFRPIMDALKDIADESLRILVPIDPHHYGIRPSGKYNAIVHARLCRLRMLGLGDGAAAKCLGLAASTIKSWRERYPKLADDMDTASELGNAHAAVILQALMRGGGPTAFNAVRFYLTTHSPEFAEKRQIEVTGDVKHTLRAIRENLYGLVGDENGDAGPILDAESSPPALPASEPLDLDL